MKILSKLIHKMNYHSRICAAGALKSGEGKVSPGQEVEGCLAEPGAWPLNGEDRAAWLAGDIGQTS